MTRLGICRYQVKHAGRLPPILLLGMAVVPMYAFCCCDLTVKSIESLG